MTGPSDSSEAADAPGGPVGYTWGDYVAQLVGEHGSLAALALRLAELATTPDDSASVERALRRLRTRGQRDGGDYGRRLLRAFGLPRPVAARVKWMGVYHSRFSDLPRSLCLDQLRVWDRPPVSESPARVWIALGLAGAALRARDLETAQVQIRRARAAGSNEPAAIIEAALVESYLASKLGEIDRSRSNLAAVEELLTRGELEAEERSCLRARWIDQQAYRMNNPGDGAAPDWRGALALYERLPAGEVHPFVGYRRDAGLAHGYYKLGERAKALAFAYGALEHAGDGGYVRLRVMGLGLLARILGDEAGVDARARALTIARRLEDEELLGRVERIGRPRSAASTT